MPNIKFNETIGNLGIVELASMLNFNVDQVFYEQREKEKALIERSYPKLIDIMFSNEADRIKEIQCDNVINRTSYCEGAEEILDVKLEDVVYSGRNLYE